MSISHDQITLVTKNLSQSWIIFSNDTSKSDCIKYRDIKILIADEEHITLLVPPSACSVGHNLSLFIFKNDKQVRTLKRMPQDKSILKCSTVNGKVQEFDLIDENLAEITLKITDRVLDYWKSFTDQIDKKQERVSELFTKYRE